MTTLMSEFKQMSAAQNALNDRARELTGPHDNRARELRGPVNLQSEWDAAMRQARSELPDAARIMDAWDQRGQRPSPAPTTERIDAWRLRRPRLRRLRPYVAPTTGAPEPEQTATGAVIDPGETALRTIRTTSGDVIEVMPARLAETGEEGLVVFDDGGETFVVAGEISMTRAEAGARLERRMEELLASGETTDRHEALRLAEKDLPAAARAYRGEQV